MWKHDWLLFKWVLHSFSLRVSHSIVPLLCALSLLFSTDCTLTTSDLRWSHPTTPIYQICDKPLDVPDGVDFWGYDELTNRLVTGEDPAELRVFDSATAFFEFVGDAPMVTSVESRFSRTRGTLNSPAKARAQTAGSPRARAKIRASTSDSRIEKVSVCPLANHDLAST